MKFDLLKTLIAIGLSALLAYACYEISDYDHVKWVITIGSFLTLSIPAIFALGLSSQQKRSGIVLKVLSWLILMIEFFSNGIFAFCDFSIPLYVIINGLILLVFVLIYNSIYRTQM